MNTQHGGRSARRAGAGTLRTGPAVWAEDLEDHTQIRVEGQAKALEDFRT